MSYDPLTQIPFDELEDGGNIPVNPDLDLTGYAGASGGVGGGGVVVPIEDEGTLLVDGESPQTIYLGVAATDGATVWWNGYAAGTRASMLGCPAKDELTYEVPVAYVQIENVLAVRVDLGATYGYADVSVYGGYGSIEGRYLDYGSGGWAWTLVDAGTELGFEDPGYDDSAWNQLGVAPFGTMNGACQLQQTVQTLIVAGKDLLLRRRVTLPSGVFPGEAEWPVDTIPDPDVYVPDQNPPAVPTGLQLTTAMYGMPDGGLYPALLAEWTANTEDDLSAYQLEVDAAIQTTVSFSLSASGTGGSLAAGEYTVMITGVGHEYGESKRSPAQEITLTAGQRLYVTITGETEKYAAYRAYAEIAPTDGIPRLGRFTGNATQTTVVSPSSAEIITAGTGGEPTAPAASTAVSFLAPYSIRTSQSSTLVAPVPGGVFHAARVRAIDTSNNQSDFTTIDANDGVVSASDTEAPSVPSALVAVPGFRQVGLRWNRSSASDIDRYEVRWCPDYGGLPNNDWTKVQARTSAVIIDGLDIGDPVATPPVPPKTYHFQVRAVDRSSNTVTSEVSATAVNADTYPDAGWVPDSTPLGTYSTTLATASAVGATNIKVASVTGISAGELIQVGTPVVGVTNPGFETGDLTGWSEFDPGSQGTLAAETVSGSSLPVGTGVYQAKINRTAAGQNLSAYSGYYDAAPGMTVTLSALLRCSIADAASLIVYWYDAAYSSISGQTQVITGIANGRYTMTTAAAPANTRYFNVQVGNGASTSLPQAVTFDDVTVVTSGAPEWRTVTTVGTAGSGGTGLDLDVALTKPHPLANPVVAVASSRLTAAPSQVGQSDIAAGTIIAAHINATIGLDAGIIKTGTLQVGAPDGMPGAISIFDSGGYELAHWDENGLYVVDTSAPLANPPSTDRRVRLTQGSLEFTDTGTWPGGVAIDADGVHGDAIIGALPGGSNIVPNSGFEHTPFATAPTSVVWTSTANWQGHIASSDINIDDTNVADKLALPSGGYSY